MEQPLISCIMPTKNRREFVAQAVYYFDKQDYPNKELIIVDDGDDLVVDLVSQRPNVRYLAPQYVHTVGAKRNVAIEAARGEIICHWDDDDWYSPSRLSYQVAPLLSGDADISGLHLHYVLDIQRMQAWQCADGASPLWDVDGMHYGTAIYWKHLWMNRSRFQDSPEGDDGAGFVRRLINFGASVCTLPCAGHQVYVRHGNNIWKYRPGTSISTERWHQVSPEQCMPQEDLSFYYTTHLQLMQRKRTNPVIGKITKRIGRVLTKKLVPLVVSMK